MRRLWGRGVRRWMMANGSGGEGVVVLRFAKLFDIPVRKVLVVDLVCYRIVEVYEAACDEESKRSLRRPADCDDYGDGVLIA